MKRGTWRKGGGSTPVPTPTPPASLRGGPSPAPGRGQTVVLSLASGRPAPHNDPFIKLREPWAGVSSDKGGRPASCPLTGVVGRGAEPYLRRTQGHEKWRPQGSQLKPLSLPEGARSPERLGHWPWATREWPCSEYTPIPSRQRVGVPQSRPLSHPIPSPVTNLRVYSEHWSRSPSGVCAPTGCRRLWGT